MFCSSNVIGNCWVICFGVVPRYATIYVPQRGEIQNIAVQVLCVDTAQAQIGQHSLDCTHVCFIIALMIIDVLAHVGAWGGSVCKAYGLHSFQ